MSILKTDNSGFEISANDFPSIIECTPGIQEAIDVSNLIIFPDAYWDLNTAMCKVPGGVPVSSPKIPLPEINASSSDLSIGDPILRLLILIKVLSINKVFPFTVLYKQVFSFQRSF